MFLSCKTMTTAEQFNHKIGMIVHSVGLSCLGGAIFLQIIVFTNIFEQGYFKVVETSTPVLSLEIALTAFTAVYFLYLYQKTICTNLKQ